MKHKHKSISIRTLVILVFVLSMLVSVLGIGTVVYSSWSAAANRVRQELVDHTGGHIHEQIEAFLEIPSRINVLSASLIESGAVDLTDTAQRERFFVSQLATSAEEIYSISYGSREGAYYGARRNDGGLPEIMRNDASTGGESWYYTVREDHTAGTLAVKAGAFDPRTRAWYTAAAAAGTPVWSPLYKHFVMEDLAVSAAWPIYDRSGTLEGVMGTHMLLSGIEDYLREITDPFEGAAILVERETGLLVANSLGRDNYTVGGDGTVQRVGIDEIGHEGILSAYRSYLADATRSLSHLAGKDRLYIDLQEIRLAGVDWIAITAVPEGPVMLSMFRSISWSAGVAVAALVLLALLFNFIIKRLFHPIKQMLGTAQALASGDLHRRAEVVRQDEIGGIATSLNHMADEMQTLVSHLEERVQERTEDLQLILDSTAEAILGIDVQGLCTFCNPSGIRLLGYERTEDLLGTNLHEKIHYQHPDGSPFIAADCKIFQAIRQGRGFEADDEVFWRADGSPIQVEYRVHPQIRNGEILGGVVTFMDITERKARTEEIEYLNCHDPLTGLHNRRCFEQNVHRFDRPDQLPLTVVFADINGLKLTNDVFGHAAGDALIRKSAEILAHSCREHDLIARTGGDEFILLLPNTSEENADKVMARIREGFREAEVAAIRCSIALGKDTKLREPQALSEVIANAENAMYKDKTLSRKAVNRDIIDHIVQTLHERNPQEKKHSDDVREIAGRIGRAMGLPSLEISRLERAAYLHDIGKIVLEDEILSKAQLTEEEQARMRDHAGVGYRILSLFDDTLDLAEYVYSHHERWDGQGYPRGLAGAQIPLISRILAVAEVYDRMLRRKDRSLEENRREALARIRQEAGTRFDPDIAALFVREMGEA